MVGIKFCSEVVLIFWYGTCALLFVGSPMVADRSSHLGSLCSFFCVELAFFCVCNFIFFSFYINSYQLFVYYYLLATFAFLFTLFPLYGQFFTFFVYFSFFFMFIIIINFLNSFIFSFSFLCVLFYFPLTKKQTKTPRLKTLTKDIQQTTHNQLTDIERKGIWEKIDQKN